MNISDIQSFTDLLTVVYRNREKREKVYHYTSYESLIKILKNRSLRLTRYDLMNDIAEKELSRCEDGDSRYIISFSGQRESVALWSLYGKSSSLKIRIEFPLLELLNSIDSNFYFDSMLQRKIPITSTQSVQEDYSKKKFSFSDVVYYDKDKHVFRLQGGPIKNITVEQAMIHRLAGTIKYDAWEYERESRLTVVLHNNHDINGNNDLTHIYAGLSEQLIKKTTILFSPWIDADVKAELQKSIDGLARTQLKYKASELEGEVGII